MGGHPSDRRTANTVPGASIDGMFDPDASRTCGLDLHERHDVAATCDEVDFADFGAHAMPEDAPAVALQHVRDRFLAEETGLVRAARCAYRAGGAGAIASTSALVVDDAALGASIDAGSVRNAEADGLGADQSCSARPIPRGVYWHELIHARYIDDESVTEHARIVPRLSRH